MKKLLFIAGLFLFQPAFAQDEEIIKFQNLYDTEKYDEVIALSKQNKDLKAKSLYYIGMSYYKKADDNNALKFLDQAIAKGPVDADMYFYKGRVLFFLRKLEDAIKCTDKAIELLPNEPDFYSGKADVYSAMGKTDSSLLYYERAVEMPTCRPATLFNLAGLYMQLENHDKALDTYIKVSGNLPPGTEDHQNCFFNMGLIYQLKENHVEAMKIFEDMVKAYPDDYHSIAKLIQVYNTLGRFDKTVTLKQTLYSAFKKNKLPDAMKTMFCFDQFKWNGKRVMAFEKFDDESDKFLSVKHIFYVLNDSSKIEFQVRSESSAAVRMAGDKSKYVLCLVKNGAYYTYWNFIFNDETSYGDIKKAVVDILEEKSKSTSATLPGKKDNKE